MVYNFCTNHLEGDQMSEKYPLWHKKYVGPYKGKHKLEKRVDANIKLIEQLISMGVPKTNNNYRTLVWGAYDFNAFC